MFPRKTWMQYYRVFRWKSTIAWRKKREKMKTKKCNYNDHTPKCMHIISRNKNLRLSRSKTPEQNGMLLLHERQNMYNSDVHIIYLQRRRICKLSSNNALYARILSCSALFKVWPIIAKKNIFYLTIILSQEVVAVHFNGAHQRIQSAARKKLKRNLKITRAETRWL